MVKKHNFAMLGLPWDFGASRGRPGARYAPETIRKELGFMMNRIKKDRYYDVERFCLVDFSDVSFRDAGDVDLPYGNIDESYEVMRAEARKIYEAGEILIGLGGDHSISWPLIAAMHDAVEGPIGIIDFDAHLDLLDESYSQGKHSQSSEIFRAIELERIDGKDVHQIGVRGYNYPEAYFTIKELGIGQYPPFLVREKGAKVLANEIMGKLLSRGVKQLYLTFDIDALDPAFAPGTGGDEVNGLFPQEYFEMLDVFMPYVKGLDIAEVNPLHDSNNICSIYAAKTIFRFMTSRASIAAE
ncbi:MAG TPA: formiminoglutamase [Clostridiales bacterium]|nr:formiminoglutamase [Clostridiales bacterium]